MVDGTPDKPVLRDAHIAQLMTPVVSCASPQTTLSQISAMMRDRRFSCVIIAENNIPVGIVTERDLVRHLADAFDGGDIKACNAAQVMSAPPITVNERDTLYDAMVLVRAHHIRHLPVVNGRGEIVGLVTQSDITRAYFRLFEDLRNTIEKSLDARTKDLLEANERLKALSLEDPLLHVGNRRAMEVDLEYTHAAYVRYRRPYSAVLFDIDCFKAYNDHYGHLAGDQALKSVADVLARGIRKTDRVYRFGGEEFLVLCPETPVDGALTLAKRLVGRVHDQRWQHAKSPHGVVTMSGGVGGVGNHEAWRDVLQEADAALYRAKAAGRNQVAWIDPFDPADHV